MRRRAAAIRFRPPDRPRTWGEWFRESLLSDRVRGESVGNGDAHCEQQTRSVPNKAQLPRFLRLQLLQRMYSADVKSLYNT